MKNETRYALGQLAELLDVELKGDAGCVIDGLATLEQAGPGKLSFLSNPLYVKQLSSCKASAVIIDRRHADDCPTNKLISSSPYVTFAHASQLFSRYDRPKSGIHPSAVVHPTASLGEGVSVGANSVIEAGVRVDGDCIIGPGCFIGEGALLGAGCELKSGVALYAEVTLGAGVLIHSGAVIGADGFGFAFDGAKSVKIAQLGGVRIGDEVEIGAGTTIDRGALEDTVIEQGVKIDNQVQIGHNCHVGKHTVICGCAALAGSVKIGEYCILGGGSGVVGHLTIADRVNVAAMSLISQSIKTPGTYSSGTGQMEVREWKRSVVHFKRLDDMSKRLKRLEAQIAEIRGSSGTGET
ncbi:MAG: UDP-3-O-(3-hydroxymyristoyl)glucosamine N-acyltransferase [Pseudohongiellaceae bacterium]